jgi:hypothetical protein
MHEALGPNPSTAKKKKKKRKVGIRNLSAPRGLSSHVHKQSWVGALITGTPCLHAKQIEMFSTSASSLPSIFSET